VDHDGIIPAAAHSPGKRCGTQKSDWAYRAIAKLGGWLNTKRTGRPSWKTLWDGWARLQERVEAAELGRNLL
jgi:hypothetical protein